MLSLRAGSLKDGLSGELTNTHTMSGGAFHIVIIQKYVRRFIARKRFVKVKTGFTKLQAVIRGFLVRQNVRKMQKSALKIQRQYRGYKKTKECQQDFFQFKKAAKVIQNEWRRWKFRQGVI